MVTAPSLWFADDQKSFLEDQKMKAKKVETQPTALCWRHVTGWLWSKCFIGGSIIQQPVSLHTAHLHSSSDSIYLVGSPSSPPAALYLRISWRMMACSWLLSSAADQNIILTRLWSLSLPLSSILFQSAVCCFPLNTCHLVFLLTDALGWLNFLHHWIINKSVCFCTSFFYPPPSLFPVIDYLYPLKTLFSPLLFLTFNFILTICDHDPLFFFLSPALSPL